VVDSRSKKPKTAPIFKETKNKNWKKKSAVPKVNPTTAIGIVDGPVAQDDKNSKSIKNLSGVPVKQDLGVSAGPTLMHTFTDFVQKVSDDIKMKAALGVQTPQKLGGDSGK
jgi:hypothetical protein